MKMIPASTHSHQLRDPHVDVIGYKVVCEVRSNSDFTPRFLKLSLVHCSFKRKYSVMT